MARHGDRPEHPHQNSNCPEHSELEKKLDPDGNPEPAHPKQGLERERVASERPQIGSKKRPGDCHQRKEHEPPAEHRGPAGSHRAQGGSTQVSEDEHPVEEYVRGVRQEDHNHDRRHPTHRLQTLPQDDKTEEGQHAGYGYQRVISRDRNYLLRLAEKRKHWAPGHQKEGTQDRQAHRNHETPLKRSSDPSAVAGPKGLRNEGIQGEERAHPEAGGQEEVEVSERHRGKIPR